MSAILDPSSATVTMVASVALLTASLGPRVPARLALRVALLIKRRAGRTTSVLPELDTVPWVLPLTREQDEPLLWLSLSVLASAAGALALLVLPLAGLWGRIHGYLVAHFFWTGFLLTGWEWLGVTLVMGGSWVVHGLVTAALAPVAGQRAEAPWGLARVVIGVLAGLGAAWLTDRWAGTRLSATQELLLGVLPMFGLSIMAAIRSQRVQRPPLGSTAVETSVPEYAGGAETWIWLSLVVWGAATAMAVSGWLTCQDMLALTGGSRAMGSGEAGLCVIMIAAGVAVAALHTRRRRKSASGCGMAMWAAGAGTGMASVLLGQASEMPGLVAGAVIALPAGYALHYAERAWIARADSESHGFARMVTALPAGAAIGLIVAEYLVLPTLGPMGMIALGALLMLGLGGLVQIFEQETPIHTQYLRLALVFGSLSAAISVFPINVQRWDIRPRTDGPRRLSILPSNPAQRMHTRRVCFIGLGSKTIVEGLAGFDGQVEVFSFGPSGPGRPSAPDAAQVRFSPASAFRALRRDRRRFDLIYQQGPELARHRSLSAYTFEWFTVLFGRAPSGGQVVVDVPLARLNRDAVRIIAVTFEQAAGVPAVWRLINPEDVPVLRLQARRDAPPLPPGAIDREWSAVGNLSAGTAMRFRPHSQARDRLGRALDSAAAESPSDLAAWLDSKRRAHDYRTPASFGPPPAAGDGDPAASHTQRSSGGSH